MTKAEAIQVINIMLQADGGCSVCGRSLCMDFEHAFPEFAKLTGKFYKQKHKEPLWRKEDLESKQLLGEEFYK